MGLRRWWLPSGAFSVALLGLLLWVSRSDEALDRGDKLAGVAGAVLAVGGLVISVIGVVVAVRANRVADHAQAADTLARLVVRQWTREAGARGLTRPIDIDWATTLRSVAPSPAEVVGDPRFTRLTLHGAVPDLADAFRALPGRQLVVVGEPGSGKTSAAILLALGLTRQRGPGDPVPLLLSLSTWDMVEHDFETWVAHRLAVDHPVFGERGVHGPQVARALVELGMVLPVLDGLDEVARAGRVFAVRAIAEVVGRNRPLVLTSRSEEYEEVIREHGVAIGRAAVVELGPVRAAAAADYLTSGVPAGDGRWDELVAELRDHPDGVVAEALSTPLAVYLAKTAYGSPGTDPADLLTCGTPDAVENHLYDAYLPALYPDHDRARRRFAFLARRLARRPGSDLSWWRLFLLLPGAHTLVAATRGAFIGTMVMAIVLLPGLVWGLLQPDPGRRPLPPGHIVVLYGILFLAAVVVGAVVGGLRGLARWGVTRLMRREEERLVHLPRYGLLRLRQVLVRLVFAVALGVAVFCSIAFMDRGIPFSWDEASAWAAFGAVLMANLGLAPRIRADEPIRPAMSLAADRRIALTLGAVTVVGLSYVLMSVTRNQALRSLGVVAAIWITAVWPMSCAWVKFEIVRFWFWAFGKTPWRLMGFLEGAHRRGVLRQVGGTYEFRHRRIQDYFAGT
ncbi:hypothetical protein [Actinosynnema sp. NPDC020468]|uniref:hypothetical protein n=1 Tax=Actinosynnema sp. NPDC020468 TaxID=3154488 RepID=UPI0033EA9028